MTLHHLELSKLLYNSTILLDTNVFSVAAKSNDFASFLTELKNDANCSYATIPSVVFEVTNGSSTLEVYNQRAEYINFLVDTVLPMKFLDKIMDFTVLMAKINANNKSFTDFQLAACLYQYKHTPIYLMTTDLRALPAFFDRKFIVTAEENSNDVKNFGIYSFNEENYIKALKKI